MSNDIFPFFGNFIKLWKISIVAWSNATNADWKFISEDKYAFPRSDHVHRCSVNGGVQFVEVDEYICKVCQWHNELPIFKVPYYATTSISKKLLDFFAQLKHEWALDHGIAI